MFTQKPQKTQGKFVCEICNFNCSRNVEWNRHISTRKHLNVYECLPENTSDKYFTCECGKIYNYRQSLYVHRKDCKKNISLENDQVSEEKNIVDNKPEKVIIVDSSNNDIIQLLIKDNNNTTINATNINDSSNKTFNLQVFLNEKCKDAMNLDDFANSIELKLSDLIRVGEEGYVPGMSKVIIERLVDTEICKRPIHCSDEKREAIQVKMANKWERETIDSENLMNAVRIVEKKQFKMIDTFRETYPECMNSESHHNDMLISLFQNLSNSREPEFIKVMKKVAKSVVINKENA